MMLVEQKPNTKEYIVTSAKIKKKNLINDEENRSVFVWEQSGN